MEYLVDWSISIDAENPTEAAAQALEMQRDPESIATVFTVRKADSTEPAIVVDLWNLLNK